MDYNTFLIRYGILPDSFKRIESSPIKTDKGYLYDLKQRTDIGRECPFCNSKLIEIKGYYTTTTNITLYENSNDVLRIKKVRFKCNKCFKTFTPKIEGIDKYSSISNAVDNSITYDFFKRQTFTDIANRYNVSLNYVIKLFDDTFPSIQRKKMPRVLCIDEFHFTKQYDQKYCCILIDFETGTVIDIIKNRQKAYLEEYFNSISSIELSNVEIFISDMYDEYGVVCKKYFKQATHIIDMFHIILQLTNAINIIRTRTMNKMIEKNSMCYNFMKKNWRFFLCRSNKIPNKTYTYKKTKQAYSFYELVFMCIKINPELLNGYNALQDLFNHAMYKTDNEIVEYMKYLSNRLTSSEDEELKKVGKTYIKWLSGISNAFTKEAKLNRYSNGLAEGMNNQIKTIIKMAYGYENFERFRKRSLLILSKIIRKKR